MNTLVLEIPATAGNGRNSEGTFFRAPNGDILYAYSRFNSGDAMDESGCDIALIRSSDEGDSWSDFSIIARAKDFGVSNIMCASALPLADGRPCVYFLIREKDGASTVGYFFRRYPFYAGTLYMESAVSLLRHRKRPFYTPFGRPGGNSRLPISAERGRSCNRCRHCFRR